MFFNNKLLIEHPVGIVNVLFFFISSLQNPFKNGLFCVSLNRYQPITSNDSFYMRFFLLPFSRVVLLTILFFSSPSSISFLGELMFIFYLFLNAFFLTGFFFIVFSVCLNSIQFPIYSSAAHKNTVYRHIVRLAARCKFFFDCFLFFLAQVLHEHELIVNRK